MHSCSKNSVSDLKLAGMSTHLAILQLTQHFFSDFGFEAIFISRLDEGERQKRMDEQSLTFLWNPFSNNFGEEK